MFLVVHVGAARLIGAANGIFCASRAVMDRGSFSTSARPGDSLFVLSERSANQLIQTLPWPILSLNVSFDEFL